MIKIRKWRSGITYERSARKFWKEKMGQGRDKRYVYVVLATKTHILYI